MYDDTATERATPNLRRPNEVYTVEMRRKYVELFQSSQPISKTEFCRQHGFSKDSLRRWIRDYQLTKTDSAPVSRNFQSSSSKPADDNGHSVTITYTEYLELLQIKAKFDAIRTICR